MSRTSGPAGGTSTAEQGAEDRGRGPDRDGPIGSLRREVAPFSRVLLRLAPRDFRDLDGLKCDLRPLSRRLDRAVALHREAKARLSDLLYDRIGDLPRSGDERYDLLDVRRRAHNDRELDEEQVELLKGYPRAHEVWKEVREADERLAGLRRSFRERHAGAMDAAAEEVTGLWDDAELREGLAAATPDLFQAVDLDGDGIPSKKALRSLSRYLYRAYAKVSPFSTFTVVGAAALGEDRGDGEPWRLRHADRSARSVSVNASLAAAVWEEALATPEIRSRLACRVNPTARRDGGEVRWYVNVENREAIRSLRAPGWWDAFVRGRDEGEEVADVVDGLAAAADLDREEAEGTVARLLEAGLLVAAPPVGVVEPDWPRKLERRFAELAEDVPAAARLRDLLARVREVAGALASAGAERRVALARETADEVLDVLGRGAEADGRFLERPSGPGGESRPGGGGLGQQALFYLDVAGDHTMTVPRDRMAALCRSLNRLADRAALLTPVAVQRKALAAYVERSHGEDASVPLLEVFEDLQRFRHRQIADPDAGKVPEWAFPGTEDLVEEQSDRVTSWCRAVAASAVERGRSADDRSVTIDERDLRAGDDALEGWLRPRRPTSRSATVQLGRRGDGTAFWTLHHPTVAEGHGRSFSRFLPVLPERFGRELRAWNRGRPYGDRLVENVDGSSYTGNAHPPLVPMEVEMPGGSHRREGAELVSVDRLAVRVREGRPELIRRSGERPLVTCDLGFQTRGRSSIFELLSLFARDGHVYLHALLEEIGRLWRDRGEDRLRRSPRILFGDRIVLRRSRWRLPARLSESARDTEPWRWFRRLRRWRERTGIPGRVFFRVPRRRGGSGGQRKPQYLCFDDPLACELLRRTAGAAEGAVQVTEMCPRPEQLPSGPAGRHALELSVTWRAD